MISTMATMMMIRITRRQVIYVCTIAQILSSTLIYFFLCWCLSLYLCHLYFCICICFSVEICTCCPSATHSTAPRSIRVEKPSSGVEKNTKESVRMKIKVAMVMMPMWRPTIIVIIHMEEPSIGHYENTSEDHNHHHLYLLHHHIPKNIPRRSRRSMVQPNVQSNVQPSAQRSWKRRGNQRGSGANRLLTRY